MRLALLGGGGAALEQHAAAGAPADCLGSVVGVVAGPQLVPAELAAPGASAFGGEDDEGSGQLLGGGHNATAADAEKDHTSSAPWQGVRTPCSVSLNSSLARTSTAAVIGGRRPGR